ncbi:hypothetical protein Tco_1264591 [Tanacetum coccineum]
MSIRIALMESRPGLAFVTAGTSKGADRAAGGFRRNDGRIQPAQLNHQAEDEELSFQMWTNKLQDALNGRKRGCTAFRGKDLNADSDSYTSVRPQWLLKGLSFLCNMISNE